ncbi:MAG TPA: phage portal protein [Rubrivivax sp.]|nr:phage portal protein [Rubrivivax sp.]
MSLLTKVIGTLSGKSDQITWSEGWIDWLKGGQATDAGVSIGRDDAMKVAAFHACVRLIALKLQSFPVDVYRRVSDTERRPAGVAPRWTRRPNGERLWPEFIAELAVSAATQGEVMLDVSRKDNAGYPSDMFAIDPAAVIVARDKGTRRLSYTMNTVDGLHPLDAGSIKHWRLMTMPGSDRGLSPLECARQELGIARAAQRYEATYFANGSTVSAVLQFPEGVGRDEAKEYVEQFRELYARGGDHHKVAGVVAAEYKPMAMSNKDAQFNELRSFSAIDITRFFNIHPTRIGEGLQTPMFGNSLEQFNMVIFQDAIQPYVTLFEAGFWELLPQPLYLKFNTSSLLRGDTRTRMDAYKGLFDVGAMSRAQIAAKEDLPVPPGGERYYLAANNYSPLDEDGVPLPPAQGESDGS